MPDLKKMLTLEALSEALPSWLKRSTKPEYNADEIDSTLTTNQFVTASDKDNWNAKGTYSKPSGGIPKSDLSSIVQTSLEKADSALQSETDPTVPSWAKQSSKPSYTQDEVPDGSTYKRVNQTEKDTWSGKQNALTTTQMQAVNSGITSAGVAQISTNQANVLYTLGKTGKNLFEFTVEGLKRRWGNGTWNGNTYNSDFGVTVVVNDNESIVVTGTPNTQTSLTLGIYDHTKYKGCIYSGGTSDVSTTTCISGVNNIGYDYGGGVTMTGDTDRAIQIAFFTGTNLNVTFKPMICTAEDWTVGHDFAPYALPNSDLTRLEAEDRAALAEEIDAGAKNLWDFANASIPTNQNPYGATYTKNDSAVTVTSTNNWGRIALGTQSALKAGTYVFRCKISNYSKQNGTPRIYIQNAVPTGTVYSYASVPGNGTVEIPFTLPSDGVVYVAYYGNFSEVTGSTDSYTASENMICTLADWKVSQKYVAYNTMAQWTKVEKEYTSTAADTMEYCGISFRVPASEIYEFIVMDRYNAGKPNGIGVADNSTNYNSNSTVIAENMADFSVSNAYPWARQLNGMTIPRSQDTRYYVWVKRGTASKNTTYLMYRRIL